MGVAPAPMLERKSMSKVPPILFETLNTGLLSQSSAEVARVVRNRDLGAQVCEPPSDRSSAVGDLHVWTRRQHRWTSSSR